MIGNPTVPQSAALGESGGGESGGDNCEHTGDVSTMPVYTMTDAGAMSATMIAADDGSPLAPE